MPAPPGKVSATRLAALGRIAGARSDADLARLAAASLRLAEATAARERLDAALADEMRLALRDPEVPVLRALDRHVLLAEQARTALEGRIRACVAERDLERARAALSFGRATVLDRMVTAARAAVRKAADRA